MEDMANKKSILRKEFSDSPATHRTKTNQVKSRIGNIVGHLQGIGNMVDEGRDCSDVLVQLTAVNASIRKLKALILKNHIENCIVNAVKRGDQQMLDKLNDALGKLIE